MPQIELSPAQRREYRARAHHLAPVLQIGHGGLTAAVSREVDAALAAHGLVKLRVLHGERAARELLHRQLAGALGAAAVQHIGKLLVLWRPLPARERVFDPERKPGPREIKVLKYGKRPGQRPELRQLRVLGNQRLSPGGQVKRARPPRQQSIKKRQSGN